MKLVAGRDTKCEVKHVHIKELNEDNGLSRLLSYWSQNAILNIIAIVCTVFISKTAKLRNILNTTVETLQNTLANMLHTSIVFLSYDK
jgi:hypothetical protein